MSYFGRVATFFVPKTRPRFSTLACRIARFFIASQDCIFPGETFASIKVRTILNARNLQDFGRRRKPPYLPSQCEIRPGKEMRRGSKVQVLHISPRAIIKAIIAISCVRTRARAQPLLLSLSGRPSSIFTAHAPISLPPSPLHTTRRRSDLDIAN